MRGYYSEDKAQRPVTGAKSQEHQKKREGEEDQKTQGFKGLTVWQKTHALTLDIVDILPSQKAEDSRIRLCSSSEPN